RTRSFTFSPAASTGGVRAPLMTTTKNISYADLAECLFGEFEALHGLTAISDTIRQCRAELPASLNAATMNVLETRARRRLATAPGKPRSRRS
ncbi:MAG: hypothetical protein J2P20_10220, partial [Pseudonocardia sp.]|nr:hypothetical protein [Pseudonocardia sp.]